MVILRNNTSGLIFAWKSGKLHCRIWKLCLLLWPRKRTAIISLNEPNLSMSKESKASHVEPQEHVDDFFYHEGTVHQKFAPTGQTVTQHYYWEVLQCLRAQICQNHPDWWQNHGCLISYDSMLVHTVLSLQKFLATKNMVVAPTQLTRVICSLVSSSCFHEWNCSYSISSMGPETQEQLLTVLLTTPKSQFEQYFQQWQKCWFCCINSEEDYTEHHNNGQ